MPASTEGQVLSYALISFILHIKCSHMLESEFSLFLMLALYS